MSVRRWLHKPERFDATTWYINSCVSYRMLCHLMQAEQPEGVCLHLEIIRSLDSSRAGSDFSRGTRAVLVRDCGFTASKGPELNRTG
jgi:hypothetical protein